MFPRFLELPLEIRDQIYHESFLIREPPFDFDYRLRHGCKHQAACVRTYYAFQDPDDDRRVTLRYLETYEHCPIGMGCKYQMQGFLALRLANRQIYEETYKFIKLPPITFKARMITSFSMASFQQQFDKPYLRDHVKELFLAFYPCQHTSNMQRLQTSMPKKGWLSKLMDPLVYVSRVAWLRIQVARGELCQECQEATIQPLLELLATFPVLAEIEIEVVSVCHIRQRGISGDLGASTSLRKRGIRVGFSYQEE